MTFNRKVYELYNEYAKSLSPDDLLGQVRRTVNGRAIDDSQVALIEAAILNRLRLVPDDFLLDLCCGNGVLSASAFEQCRGGTGVDFGDFLIEVANKHFGKNERSRYVVDDVAHYLMSDPHPTQYTKIMCYSSFQYFDAATARRVLTLLFDRYTNVKRVLLGNMPDRARMSTFYGPGTDIAGVENNCETAIGLWRSEDDIAVLAKETGWNATCVRMPKAFYAAHYRFDAILSREVSCAT